MENKITKDELIFIKRMLPHFMAGKSIDECAKAVIEDDERLYIALHQRRHSYFVPTYCERGRSYQTNEDKGDIMIKELSDAVYNLINKN